MTHIDEKPLECTQCNKSFSNPDTLKIHMLRHTGENTYHCSFCDKSYSLNHNFESHLEMHSYEKTFQCISHVLTMKI